MPAGVANADGEPRPGVAAAQTGISATGTEQSHHRGDELLSRWTRLRSTGGFDSGGYRVVAGHDADLEHWLLGWSGALFGCNSAGAHRGAAAERAAGDRLPGGCNCAG